MKDWYFDLKMEELGYAVAPFINDGLTLTLKQADSVRKKLKHTLDNLKIEEQ